MSRQEESSHPSWLSSRDPSRGMKKVEVGLEPEEHERFLTSLKGRVMAGKRVHILECL